MVIYLYLQLTRMNARAIHVTHSSVSWTSQSHLTSGVARVIVLGGQVASGEGILGGLPPNFYTDLDF